jgi:hypothetical protein
MLMRPHFQYSAFSVEYWLLLSVCLTYSELQEGELHMVGCTHPTGSKSQVPSAKSQTNSKYESQNTQMDGGF